MTTSAVNQMNGSGPDPVSGGEEVCLVMMPFSKVFDPVMDAIRVGVDRAGVELRCRRLDDLSHPGAIVDDLTREITMAEVCIADLSGLNPNVMWEVGFAMSNKKPVILLSQDIRTLPFDISGFRVIQYDLSTVRQTLPEKIIIALANATRRLRALPAGVDRSETRAAGGTNSDIASSQTGDRPKAVRGGRGIRISLSILFSALLALPGILWFGPLRSYRDEAADLKAWNEEYKAETTRAKAERDTSMREAATLAAENRRLSRTLDQRRTTGGLGTEAVKAWMVAQLKEGTWKGQFQYVDRQNSVPVPQSLNFSGFSAAPKVQLHTGIVASPVADVKVDDDSIRFVLPTDTRNVKNLYDLHFCLAGRVMQGSIQRGAVSFDNKQ